MGNDDFFSEKEINEHVELIKNQRKEREAKELEKKKGFTITCKNCGSTDVEITTEKDFATYSTEEQYEITNVYIICSCGNKESVR